MSDDDDWVNPEHPPVEATDLGGGVWVSWEGPFEEYQDGQLWPVIWHWCDRSVVKATDTRPDVQSWWYEPRWDASGVRAHQFVSREPLHLEPSLYWPECCGKHGFVRDGHWNPV